MLEEMITQEPFKYYHSNLAHWSSMPRARILLFLVDLGHIGRGHLGKIDIVWPILFKPGTMLKHTTSAPCQFQVTLIKVTLIQKVKVIWGDL
jgi:hypothetical protein